MQVVQLGSDTLEPFATQLRPQAGHRTAYPVATDAGDVPGRLVFSTMIHAPVDGDIVISRLERHPHTSQSLLALNSGRWLVVVAPTKASGEPDLDAAKGFIAGAGDAICFHRNVWHASLAVMDKPAEIAMMMWKADNGDDNAFYDLPTPLILRV